jgi:hypothetical protein
MIRIYLVENKGKDAVYPFYLGSPFFKVDNNIDIDCVAHGSRGYYVLRELMYIINGSSNVNDLMKVALLNCRVECRTASMVCNAILNYECIDWSYE